MQDNIKSPESEASYIDYLDVSRLIQFIGSGKDGAWKEICSREQIDRLTDQYGPLLEKLGYEV